MSPREGRDLKAPRIGVFGWGVVAPGAKDVAAFHALLSKGTSALALDTRAELGRVLFAAGQPAFHFEDYAHAIAKWRGDAYVSRLRTKMGDNVKFAVGACVQAIECQPGLEEIVREADDLCHVYVGSGVGDLPESYAASRSIERATRAWNHFWADAERCAARRRFDLEGALPPGDPPPTDPRTLPVDSEPRLLARLEWDAYWAARSEELSRFQTRYAQIERLDADREASDSAHLDAIRKRQRAHRKVVEEIGCPTPPWTSVSPNLIWNIQNSPAAQITMLLDVHGAAWAPVGACSTFGVALKCGMDAITRGEAKVAIVGTTDPRPDPALVAAFHEARVMPGTGEVNVPFTSLRGTHVSGGACICILGDEDHLKKHGLLPLIHVSSVALASDAEHIITPSKTGPKRAIARAYEIAGIKPSDVALVDLHATGTPGDLNELALVRDFIGPETRIVARKGQLGHGMSNSGGWELTALALSLRDGAALPTGIPRDRVHPRVEVTGTRGLVTDRAELSGVHGVKLMLGIGGITACVVLERPQT